ncbi:MAG TPA: sigma 54-interacting transcriptional regulator, partial [Terriglobales bacterium]|nr:sigma 54-interacting transcriptional regulator [Terriglobales bacterium]
SHVAETATTVLIEGETGTGKEQLGRAIHAASAATRPGPFVAINCAAIPEALLESELFGYARGAFTGAVQSRVGRVQSAQGGTLFLDEIGDMPAGLQAKLLRFLESGELQRLGSSENCQVDVRIVAATNAELLEKVKDGSFRQDLYFRLSVFPIELPPLSQHKKDLRRLASFFLRELEREEEVELSDETMELLEGHSWPGNVRELRHVLERALIMANGAKVISPLHIQFASMGRSFEGAIA